MAAPVVGPVGALSGYGDPVATPALSALVSYDAFLFFSYFEDFDPAPVVAGGGWTLLQALTSETGPGSTNIASIALFHRRALGAEFAADYSLTLDAGVAPRGIFVAVEGAGTPGVDNANSTTRIQDEIAFEFTLAGSTIVVDESLALVFGGSWNSGMYNDTPAGFDPILQDGSELGVFVVEDPQSVGTAPVFAYPPPDPYFSASQCAAMITVNGPVASAGGAGALMFGRP